MPHLPEDREYRSMVSPLSVAREDASRKFDTDYYVEGYASTFNDPYMLYKDGDWEYWEVIDPAAFDGADMTDVILQYDHSGRVFARMSNHTLHVEPDAHGLFVAADLGKTTLSRQMWEDVATGLVTRMSWAFRIAPEGITYTEDEASRRVTSTVTRVSKVYDVSAVSLPADPNTSISARSILDGVIGRKQEEHLLRVAADRERARSLLALKARAAIVRNQNR